MLKTKVLLLLLSQSRSVQMCDVVNEIELERERCENQTAGNVTSGNVHVTFKRNFYSMFVAAGLNITDICIRLY